MSILRARILGTGSALPEKSVANAELASRVDTSDEWITQRTGIRSRHIAGEGESTAGLALAAATQALKESGIGAAQVDAVIAATTTPDEIFPSVATRIQAGLGMTRGFAFDVQAVCSGFLYALTVADQFIRNGTARTVLVTGAETLSRIVDWTDRSTCILFGDGAGAVVLRAFEDEGSSSDRGILGSRLYSDGRMHDLLYAAGGPGSAGPKGAIKMQGREVFRHAVDEMAKVVDEVLTAGGFSRADLDWLVPHQANRRIIEATAQKLGLSMDKVVLTVDHHGNTSAASIPLALHEARARFRPGDLMVLEALGGGFTWGGVALRW